MDSGADNYRRFLDGDKNGLAEIIREYRDGLILFVNGYANNICVAEEIVEEVFIKLVFKKPKFSGKSSFKTWLYSIGRFTALDILRHNARRNALPIDDFYDISDEESLEINYIKEEQRIMLHKAVKKLNPDYCQVLYLIFFEGFDNAGAAKIMKKTNRQIENLIYCAKKALKSELDREGFIYEKL